MRKTLAILMFGLSLLVAVVAVPALRGQRSESGGTASARRAVPQDDRIYTNDFRIEVLVNGTPREELRARGGRYVEAQEGAEYSLRIHNPLNVRVAVALAVDGLNTIDARRTTAWNASKWVIQPYQTITVRGWQMSSNRARRFYFTTEQDSYANRINRASDVGVIAAVFFREREPVAVASQPPYYDSDRESSARDERGEGRRSSRAGSAPSTSSNRSSAEARTSSAPPDDTHAATGIGRNVNNSVNWVNLDLDSNPYAEVTLRYEYRDALVRLGIIPRRRPAQTVIRRRENATGFEDGRYSPEP